MVPAALIFTDGCTVGAKLDRNGLRPLRYTLTSDGLLVVGSEVGIADLHGKEIAERQRLGPGEILLVNPASGEFVRPKDSLRLRDGIRADLFAAGGAGRAHRQTRILIDPRAEADDGGAGLERRSVPPAVPAAGGTRTGSGLEHGRRCAAGFDVHLPRPLWDYCKQRFAQVTNPPIDSLRETHVMSLKVFLGRAALNSPLLDGGQLQLLQKELGTTERIPFTFLVPRMEWRQRRPRWRACRRRQDSFGQNSGSHSADRPRRGPETCARCRRCWLWPRPGRPWSRPAPTTFRW